MNRFIVLMFLPVCLLVQDCYSFKGISIDPRVTTFFVRTFDNAATNAPPTIALDFTEQLKDKIRRETRLQLTNAQEAHVVFSGSIVDYRVVPVAPKPNETVTFNRLEITINIQVENQLPDKVNWPNGRNFQFFAEFQADRDLLSTQSVLIDQIFQQILEDTFNHFFNNW